MSSLAKFHERYETIIQSEASGPERDKHLAALMTDMEHEFSIPALHNPEWERKNRPVIALYRIISETRGL